MTIAFKERTSDVPIVEKIMSGYTVTDGAPTRPAEMNWHMVLTRRHGITQMLLVGPWAKSDTITYQADAEILWIQFRLGAFMPHLPTRDFTNSETPLPLARSNAFWLKGSAWQFPTYENADTFVNRLVRQDILLHDPIIHAPAPDLSPRTIRHRFLRATGLTQSYIDQMHRARKAVTLLQSGVSILDTVFEAGYYDQSHLTRSLKQFFGKTPAQIAV